MNVGGEDTSGLESGQGRRLDAGTRRQRARNMRKTENSCATARTCTVNSSPT